MTKSLKHMLELEKLSKLDWGGHGELPFSKESITFFISVIADLEIQPKMINPTGRESIVLIFDSHKSIENITMEIKPGEVSFVDMNDGEYTPEVITINTRSSKDTAAFINSKVYDEDALFNRYYDDEEFLKEHIKDLRTLRKIHHIRMYNRTNNNIYLFGDKVWLNTGGNLLLRNPLPPDGFPSYSVRAIPKHDQICPHCKEKFEVEDAINDNCVQIFDKWSDDGNEQLYDYYHKHCVNAHNNEVELERFIDIVSDAYPDITYKDFHAIKNKYCQCDHCADWFTVDTTDGRFIIGWRKRVMQVIWLDDYKKFTDNFEDQNVTHNLCDKERYIHAWTEDMAKLYIKRAKESIIKDGDDHV